MEALARQSHVGPEMSRETHVHYRGQHVKYRSLRATQIVLAALGLSFSGALSGEFHNPDLRQPQPAVA